MEKELEKDYSESKVFWDKNFELTDEQIKEFEASPVADDDWKQIARCQKLFDAAASLGSCTDVLDYGCGEGWASIIAKNSGSKNVTGVDLSANAAKLAAIYAKTLRAPGINFYGIDEAWLDQQPDNAYDGIFCSNVLDVIPLEVTEAIIQNLARIAKSGASVIIGMNYYQEPKENPERGITVKNKNCIYVNNILRMVSLSDEEWTDLIGKYFTVEKLDHFAWEGELKETRRLFYLRKN